MAKRSLSTSVTRRALLVAAVLASWSTFGQPAQGTGMLPDLVVSHLTDPPARVTAATFAIQAVVENIGYRRSKPSTMYYYASLDRTRDADDVRFRKTSPTPSVEPHRPFRVDVALIAPADLKDGTFYLLACADAARKVKERDETNNCRAAGQFRFSNDVAPPTVAITAPGDAATTGPTVTVTFAASSDTTGVACLLDNVSVACDSGGSVALTGLSDGSHTFSVTASDAAGNSASDAVTWTVDAKPPTITSLTTTSVSGTSESIDFTASDQSTITEIRCVLDGVDTTCGSGTSGSQQYDGLSSATHTVEVYAVDVFGNSGASSTPGAPPSARATASFVTSST